MGNRSGAYWGLVGRHEGRRQLLRTMIDGRIILTWIFKK